MIKTIAQGAEATLTLQEDVVSKSRTPKSYRHPILDKQIRTRRTRFEAKLLLKAHALKINVPKILGQDTLVNLNMEFINGETLSKSLNDYSSQKQKSVMKKFGKQVALLHQNNLIHGDLTTSNAIFSNGKVFIIDFGLGFISPKIENKAVDVHLIKQALHAKHFQNYEVLFKEFIKGYNLEEKEKILERLKAIEKRGRYRH